MASSLTITSEQMFACILDGQGGAAALTREALDAWTSSLGTLWVHLNYTNHEHQDWLRRHSGLDELVVDALLVEDTRPRASALDGGLLLALRGVNLSPGADPEDMVSIRLWIEQGRIISARKRKLLSVSDITERLERGAGPASSGDFIETLVDRLTWHMSDTVDQFEDRLAEIEECVVGTARPDLRLELAAIRRQVITLRRYLAPQREAVSRIISEPAPWLDTENRQRLREDNDRLTRHIEDLDAVRERAAITQEEMLSRLSEQLNTRMYVLSILSAIFLPLGFLTGLFGINVGGIPGSGDSHAFWLFIVALGMVMSFQLVLLKWKRWF
ncbi:MAG: zinc transporter ZntB [Betaproteobacteria bacterium]|nr:zinc transporter ZntB [Betaproteobacteria bacterium]